MKRLTAPQTRVRLLISFFIFALIAAGLTAFPLSWELDLLEQIVRASPIQIPALIHWVVLVNGGLQATFR